MEFNSLFFLFVYLPLFIGSMFFLKRNEVRNVILLLFSLLFYAFGDLKHLILLLCIILLTYFAALKTAGNKKIYRLYLALVIACLCFFKYGNYVVSALSSYLSDPDLMKIVMPLGISFYTFTAISYVSDVYYEKYEAEKNFFNILSFLTFFPVVISGPLIRYGTFREYLNEKKIDTDTIAEGLRRFLIGLGKKVIIANQLNIVCSAVFNDAARISFPLAWYGILSYSLQLYYDFSGYSDMAIGIGKMIGYSVPENFNDPYFSHSIAEFWRRWHMTLGSWFKDYLFYPASHATTKLSRKLPFQNKKTARNFARSLALLIVWVLEGAWHGANIFFILFGLYHGTFIILDSSFGSFYSSWRKKLHIDENSRLFKAFQIIRTFFLVMIGMVLFRGENAGQIIAMYKGIFFHGAPFSMNYIRSLDILYLLFYFLLGVIFLFPFVHRFFRKISEKLPVVYDIGLFLLGILSILLLVSGSYSSFIYFNF